MNSTTNASLAHALARIGLGINITLHGWTRLPNLEGFASGLAGQFAESLLPPGLVQVSAWGIAIAESIIGPLLVLGFLLRPALVAGTLLMIFLLSGACLIQNWNAAGIQMTYLGFYCVLLATLAHDRFSIDQLIHSKKISKTRKK